MDRKNIFETVSQKGIRIVGEVMPGAYSVSLCVWVKSGSVFEDERTSGISHFIEHMVFKGTQRRTAKQIAQEMDAVGGSINAFTAKENTCFYTRTLAEDMPLAIDLLLDMVCSPLLADEDIENEQGVVCEEIFMSDDDPTDVVHEVLCQTAYEGSPIASPILGTCDTVRSFTSTDILSYMDKHYRPEDIVISASGAFSPDELVKLVDEKFILRADGNTSSPVAENIFRSGRNYVFTSHEIEQAHICLAFKSDRSCGEMSPAVNIVNAVFGSATSSRLFQHIREEQGLAYSVYSMNSSYSDTGYWTIYAGTSEANAERVLRCIMDELKKIRAEGMTDEEFTQAKEQLRRGYILGLENVSVHASSIGKDMLTLGRVRDDDDILGRLAAVTKQDADDVIKRIVNNNMTLSVVGRTDNPELTDILNETDFE